MTATGLVDSHCHLNYDYAPKIVDDLIREAAQSGVSHLVTIGTEIQTIPQIQAISDQFENVYHTVGVHPHDVKALTEADIQTLRRSAAHPKCRAIGEIGLDYHYNHSPAEDQKRWLKAQLDLALELNLPVVIHAREAEADLLPLLSAYAQSARGLPGAIHCFTGTLPFGEACINLGFFISFSGILTFKSAIDLQNCAIQFPLEKLMVETDSPYLAPIPFRGKKCEPAMVRFTAEKLAELKGVTLDAVTDQTARNAKALFRITA